jgi:ribosomal protein S18 acetylase RimI-like enzyme
MEIHRIAPDEAAKVHAAAESFDQPPTAEATERFLHSPGHHLLIGYLDGQPAGMITGVELTHPDKGTEMFLYELGVREEFRRRGLGRALVAALARLAEDRGCYGMWVLTEDHNEPALRTYHAAGGTLEEQTRLLAWNFTTD